MSWWIAIILAVALLLALWFTAYSFGDKDGSERQDRIHQAEIKLIQSKAKDCGHQGRNRGSRT